MGPDKDGQELLRRESGPRGRSLQHMVTAPSLFRAHFGPVSRFCGNVRPLCSCRGSRVGLGVYFQPKQKWQKTHRISS